MAWVGKEYIGEGKMKGEGVSNPHDCGKDSFLQWATIQGNQQIITILYIWEGVNIL